MVNGFSMSRISDRQIPYMRRTIGVIFQDFRLIPKKTVFDNLSLAMRAVGATPRDIRTRIPYVLELVGLKGMENRYPDELSGGEQRRGHCTGAGEQSQHHRSRRANRQSGSQPLAGDHDSAGAHQRPWHHRWW